MRVMITGGAGLIGRAVAAHLLERGYDVHLTDLVANTDAPYSTYGVCDVTNYDAVLANMRGCDWVVHMAALRNPLYGPGPEVFRVNTIGTFNVFEAAAKLGIRRVVQASSINALGCAWNTHEFMPHYFPIDEDHPLNTTDPYSLSKQQIEEIGAYYWRRDGISSAALRLPGVYSIDADRHAAWLTRRRESAAFFTAFLNLPRSKQAQLYGLARDAGLAFRAARRLEYPDGKWHIPSVAGVDDRLLYAYTFERYNLWASIDDRDAALAVELGLTAAYDGAHPLFVNARTNTLGVPTETLLRVFFADVTARIRPLVGTETPVSIDRARRVIGFEPRHALEDEEF